jgi:hypothetical protein
MAAEIIPKIADIATLKGLSMLLALPMICVAYTFQTGLVIGFEESIFMSFQSGDTVAKILFIFICKSTWISFYAIFIYGVARYLQIGTSFQFLYIISVILISIAMMGIFGKTKIPELQNIDNFWFYGCIVWGVFLQTTVDEINEHT